ncbi:MAG: PQQ-like beta-propeller repeat protein [Neomegalonema sp.]|nr:PQQ-like beta-propeller repeat protein [Neomegalonema sp.]
MFQLRLWGKSSTRIASILTGASLCLGLSACGYYFGEEDAPLPGERVSIRNTGSQVSTDVRGAAALPAATKTTTWEQVGGSSLRTRRHIEGALALEEIWSRSIGAGSDDESRIIATPVVRGDLIIALDAAAQVTALKRSSGEEAWSLDLTPEGEDGRDGFGGGLAVYSDTLIVATGFGRVHGVGLFDGKEQWVYQAPFPIRSAPALARGTLVVQTRGGVVIGLDAKTGEQRWKFAGPTGGAGMLSAASPAIAGEIVALPFSTGDLMVARLRDGRRGWIESIGANRRGSAMSLVTDITASPVIEQGRVFTGSISGRVAAFELSSGRRLWGRDIGVYNPIWSAGQSIFLVSEDAKVMALTAVTGATIWQTQLPQFDDPEDRRGAFAYGGPVLIGGKLYLTSSQGTLFELDAKTGEKLREVEIGAATLPPIAVDGILYVLDERGTLHALR